MNSIDAYHIYRKVWAEENIFSLKTNLTININGNNTKEN